MGICADPCKGSNGFQADNFTFLGPGGGGLPYETDGDARRLA